MAAGPIELEPKETSPPPSITDNDHWSFNIALTGWMPFLSGDIGLHGFTSNVNVNFGQILTHVAGIGPFSADARKGRFGVHADIVVSEPL